MGVSKQSTYIYFQMLAQIDASRKSKSIETVAERLHLFADSRHVSVSVALLEIVLMSEKKKIEQSGWTILSGSERILG